jgi:hypothetical protein
MGSNTIEPHKKDGGTGLRRSDKFTSWVLKMSVGRFNLPILTTILVALVVSLLVKTGYLLFDTSHYYIDHTIDQHPYLSRPIDKFIRELDIAGLLGGVIGILISLYITGVIERGNKYKEEENNKTVQEITEVVKNIWEKDRNFHPVDNVRHVFSVITSIFDLSIASGKKLYVMNHSASFGYLLGLKLHSILDYHKLELADLKKLSYMDYYRYYEEYEQDRKTQIKFKQTDAGMASERNGHKSIYVTLSPEPLNGQIPYILNYLHELVANPNVNIIFYDSLSDQPLSEIQHISEPKEIDNYYFVPLDVFTPSDLRLSADSTGTSNSYDDAKLRQLLLDKLVETQKSDILQLEAAKFDVRKVANIYYQVYLNELSNSSEEGSCLFMFINHQTLWKAGKKLLAFEARKEKYVTDSFINIINSTE